MAIIQYKGFNQTVETITDRNNITRLVDGMVITVKDAIADPQAGSGVATYRYLESESRWILISKSSHDSINFITEELTINDNAVTLSQFPVDNQLWNIVILDDMNIVIGEIKIEDLTISGTDASGGVLAGAAKLRATYAYGEISPALDSYIDSKVEAGVTSGIDLTGYYKADGSTSITGDIVPDVADTYTLGSAEKPFKDLYVGANSLYVDGQKVIQSDAGTIVVTADMDQNVQLKTTGAGDIEFYPNGSGVIQLKGSVQIPSTETLMTNDNGTLQIGNDTKITGDLTVTGSINADNIQETVTSLTLAGNQLQYTDEDGNVTTHDLTTYLDDTNLARIIAGSYNSVTKQLVFTRDDASTFTIDAAMFLDDTNLVTSVAGKTGAVTLTKTDISDFNEGDYVKFFNQSIAPTTAPDGALWRDSDDGIIYVAINADGVLSWFEI